MVESLKLQPELRPDYWDTVDEPISNESYEWDETVSQRADDCNADLGSAFLEPVCDAETFV